MNNQIPGGSELDKCVHRAMMHAEDSRSVWRNTGVQCHRCGAKLATYYCEERLCMVRCRKCETVTLAEKAEAAASKAEYWESKANEITLAMPESLKYFKERLEKATAYHQGLKDGTIERGHSYSLTYAKKDVNELKKKVEIAELLWGCSSQETGEGDAE